MEVRGIDEQAESARFIESHSRLGREELLTGRERRQNELWFTEREKRTSVEKKQLGGEGIRM